MPRLIKQLLVFLIGTVCALSAVNLPLATVGPAFASTQSPYVTAALIADSKSIQPGHEFRLGVKLKMQPGWHTYYKQSGDAGMPTKIVWKLPAGFKAGELQWEKPNKFVDAGITTYGYHDETLIAAPISVPANLPVGTPITLGASVKWLSCKDICIPGGDDNASITLPVQNTPSQPDHQSEFGKVGFSGDVSQITGGDAASKPDQPTNAGVSGGGSILDQKLNIEGTSDKQMGLAAYLGCAFIGGLILNLMPCVLPVIAIKVVSLFEQANEEPARVKLLGLTFSAGILSSFLVLALVVVSIQMAGQKVGWGFQFQYPGFLIAMCAIVLLFALSLFGLFYVSVSTGQDQIDQLASREGFVGTFFKGVLATILSTPCTAPFLGTALGFAFSQSPLVVISIFMTAALGMSFPYLVLTVNPNWMKYMPKPGVWMEKFKESMGFLLLATVAWLLGVLGTEVGVSGMSWTLGFLIALAFCAWIVARFTDLSTGESRKRLVQGIALVIGCIAFYVCILARPEITSTLGFGSQGTEQPAQMEATLGGIAWEPFNVAKLDQYLSEGKTVLLDFTADWCLTCKVNENTVLATAPVVEKIKALNVVTMRADWTRQDPSITKLLNKFNRSGVPLYVIFPSNKPSSPIVLPEVITQPLMIQKLEEAGPSRSPQ